MRSYRHQRAKSRSPRGKRVEHSYGLDYDASSVSDSANSYTIQSTPSRSSVFELSGRRRPGWDSPPPTFWRRIQIGAAKAASKVRSWFRNDSTHKKRFSKSRKGREGARIYIGVGFLLLAVLLIAILAWYWLSTGAFAESPDQPKQTSQSSQTSQTSQHSKQPWESSLEGTRALIKKEMDILLSQDLVKQGISGLKSVKEVEMVVERIVEKQLRVVKADIGRTQEQHRQKQLQNQKTLEAEIEEMRRRQDGLRASLMAVKDSIVEQKGNVGTAQVDMEKLRASLKAVQDSISEQKDALDSGQGLQFEGRVDAAELERKIAALHTAMTDLDERAAACLKESTISESDIWTIVEEQAGSLRPNVTASSDYPTPTELHPSYISREELDIRLQELVGSLDSSLIALIEKHQVKVTDDMPYQPDSLAEGLKFTESKSGQADIEREKLKVKVTESFSGQPGRSSSDLGGQNVQNMIKEALLKYDADKLGLADFALESLGGSIVQDRCSKPYMKKGKSLIQLFGFPLWYIYPSPRHIIQPDMHPGQCWAFEGSKGHIVIRTNFRIQPTAFTLDHVARSLMPSGEISSAPKHFMVSGLVDEDDYYGQWFGNFTYNNLGNPVQLFRVQMRDATSGFNLFQINVLSNYGNKEYTCIYRFRIHGKLWKPS